jgi:hypothetical protein
MPLFLIKAIFIDMKIKFSYIMLILALVVAGSAGYFSVWGLSQLFAGASTAVIVMATVLEIGKVVTTTALHRYWYKLATGLKIYLTISVMVLMVITSAGIYGFLSNAYQKTANKLEIHEGELAVLDGKKGLFEKSILDNEKIVATKNKRIDMLGNLRNNQETRLDSAKSNRAKDKVRQDIELATNEIQKLTNDIDGLNTKNAILSDSVSKYNTKALELKSGSEVAGEVGPLKYIAELTGSPMSKVVNYLILLLIFVFDPLAIALILATNRVFELDGQANPLEPKKDETKEVLEAAVVVLQNEGVNEGVNEYIEEEIEPLMVDEQHDDDAVIEPVTDAVIEPVTDAVIEPVTEVVEPWDIRPMPEEVVENITTPQATEELVIPESKHVSEKVIEVPVKTESPVVTTGKVELEEIKEIKESHRGYSVPVPQPKGTNTIERIGSNKVVKNGDNNKFFFKRK